MILKHGFQVAMVVCLSNVGFASAQELGGYEFLSLGGTPHDVVYDANRNLAYVSNRSANQIHVVSLATRQLVQNITVGNMPTGMAITADGNQLLAVYSNDAQMGVIDLNTLITVQTINLPQNNNHVLLRVNVASTGEVLWRDATTSNPYGHIYSLDPDTGISTRLFSTQPVCRYSPSYDGSQFLIMFECDDATVWDAQTQSAPAPQQVPGFSYGNGGWITQGTLRNAVL
jgi:YVTN family beta-propeller protein